MNGQILLAEDDELQRHVLAKDLRKHGYDVVEAGDGVAALETIARCSVAALVLDLGLPRLDGLGVLRACRERHVGFPIIVTTGQSDIATAVEATRLGAAHFLTKPFAADALVAAISAALTAQSKVSASASSPAEEGYAALIGRSPAMLAVFQILRRLESVDAPTVLITGESGTGKELVAQAIHARGRRAKRPYMAINCAALPETLIETELFGHERGAFTDAQQQKAGLFEAARGGVVFLDEIGELSLGTQAKLLRALENRRFKRVGGVEELQLDAAIIAATNRDPRQEVASGGFREDLFFRLNVVPIELPPLRQRLGDLEALALALTERAARELRRPVTGVSSAALALLRRCPWQGNVRELRNVIERAVVLKDGGGVIDAVDLPSDLAAPAAGEHPFALPDDGVDLAVVERELIEQALERTHGNQTRAASLLGISRFALRHRMKKNRDDAGR